MTNTVTLIRRPCAERGCCCLADGPDTYCRAHVRARRVAHWQEANRVRVGLVLDLAGEGIDIWEPDMAFSLLQAAWLAIANVGDCSTFDGTQEWPPLEEHELGLRRAVREETQRLIETWTTEDTYGDGAILTTLDEARALCRMMDRFIARYEETE